MEYYCLGASKFATMAVSPALNHDNLRNKMVKQRQNFQTFCFWRPNSSNVVVECSSRRSGSSVLRSANSDSSCVIAPEDFANEEDFIKAGGSELLYVQMQQNKAMDCYSKISDKLRQISDANELLDMVVIGCGPAGLALAAESAKLGLKVGLVGPDLPFTNNYGVWEDEFRALGLGGCIEHVWRDTIVYIDDDNPIYIGRSYGKVSRQLLHKELVHRCLESGVSYLNAKVENIMEGPDGHRLVACERGVTIPCRLVTVASGAASGKLLEYEVGGPRVCVQTAYGVEVEVENSPYDPNVMVFMDYRDYTKLSVQSLEAKYPTFLYAMPISPTRIFFEETCLASVDAMPFDLLKKKLMTRLQTMGVRITKIYEEEWSYIPVGGSLPNTEQRNLAFGAAASMVHPATGYSVVRSLSEAPKYASAIANLIKNDLSKNAILRQRSVGNISMQAWNTLWPQERKRQRAFFLFGLSLIVQLDIEGIRTFFRTFFRVPKWMWEGFLGSNLSSADLILFAFYMFFIAPNDLRMGLIRHLLSDPTGATMIRTYITL
ncbi:lycopene epsilon cyclase, chloroplastic [Spinacia oleracea]|uniref:Lycopene epsilon cyclase, chloroplastic n=2 Tax=Spinacia oleracea TaxID=3562 RepID=A0A9R0JZ30_SPIOL|nr:lycopene epsilon cyclase, chloroplastic [Spinacia oleracea]